MADSGLSVGTGTASNLADQMAASRVPTTDARVPERSSARRGVPRGLWRFRNGRRPTANVKTVTDGDAICVSSSKEVEEEVRNDGEGPRRGQRRMGARSMPAASRYEYRRFRAPKVQQRPLPNPRRVTANEQNVAESLSLQNDEQETSKAIVEENAKDEKRLKRRVCKYFAAEQTCYFGDRCRFRHVIDEKPQTDILGNAAESVMNIREPEKKPPVAATATAPRFLLLTKDCAGSETQRRARDSEIAYLLRRFPKTTTTSGDNGTDVQFAYAVTDPEWKFDVNCLVLSLHIPLDYPLELSSVRLIGPELPLPLATHIEKTTNEFLASKFALAEAKNAYDCVGRSLIRWIDRSVLEMFVSGLRKTRLAVQAEKAGISLVMPAEAKSPLPIIKQDSASDAKETNFLGEAEDDSEETSGLKVAEQTIEEEQDVSERKTTLTSPDAESASAPPASLEVRLQWSNVSGNVASLSVASLAMSLKCARCDALFFQTCTPRKCATSRCLKCGNGQSVQMFPELVHEHSNVIARLEPKGCRPVDCVLLSSSFRLVCLSCNKEATAENLVYGSAHKTWCYSCHAKCEFEISAVRFSGNFQSILREDESVQRIKVPRKKKPEQSVVIVEGEPLPENGTCKHYRKSYRWFRFPCCGKVYPCDSCHNEVETDHEMKLANRMVCGFCSKEQPFQKSKPCVNCNENVTRTKSTFWEGGKGCRDQVLMNRNENRKHTNSRLKTVSKKGTEELAAKKKSDKKDAK